MRIPTIHVVMATLSGIVLVAISLASTGAAQTQPAAPPSHVGPIFQSATTCMACHNGLTTPTGEDVSMGTLWRASMMAHAARDPYWHAGVRREVTDYPAAQAGIENECSRCHMPMAHVQSQAAGHQQSVFSNLPVAGGAGAAANPLAVDGVSCALCHQITRDNLGTKASFTGGFSIDTTTPPAGRPIIRGSAMHLVLDNTAKKYPIVGANRSRKRMKVVNSDDSASVALVFGELDNIQVAAFWLGPGDDVEMHHNAAMWAQVTGGDGAATIEVYTEYEVEDL